MMRRALTVLVLLAALPYRAFAQKLGVEMLTDLELWKTHGDSPLLARNEGELQAIGRLRGWVSLRPFAELQLLAMGELQKETGAEGEFEKELEVLTLRWLPRRGVSVEAGRILMPLGEFGPRRFSNINPLIGTPDLYPDAYPWGTSVSGAAGKLDYRAALISLPVVNQGLTPEPGQRLRPLLGIGVSAGPMLRVGATLTHGAYLGPAVGGQIPSGASWQDFLQTVVSADAHFSAGYVEARVEALWSSFEVPSRADPVRGLGWYGEVRATLSPRLFVAGRFERNRFATIEPTSAALWAGQVATELNGEVGAGYRVSADALIKASFSKDHWPGAQPGVSDGYALAVQFSLHKDIGALLARRY
jgi:hypothetical protein